MSAPRRERIGLVGCVKTKLASPAPARDLYRSALFQGRRRWVEQSCDQWLIISARHGLVDPAQVLAPYQHTLGAVSADERRVWAQRVLADLEARVGPLGAAVYEIHAGAAYRDCGLVEGLIGAGAVVEVPAAGLSQGEQLAMYSRRRPLAVEPRVALAEGDRVLIVDLEPGGDGVWCYGLAEPSTGVAVVSGRLRFDPVNGDVEPLAVVEGGHDDLFGTAALLVRQCYPAPIVYDLTIRPPAGEKEGRSGPGAPSVPVRHGKATEGRAKGGGRTLAERAATSEEAGRSVAPPG